MINVSDILETITMFEDENLDVRTITMGISLLDCCDSDINKTCARVYDKITRYAKNLVATGEQIEKEFGVPIIHKRISVTPIAMILAACEDKDAVKLAVTLEKAATACGVNFIGGFSALVQKGFSPGDRELIEAIPEALSVTEHVCSSVNIGSTKAGINMDAVGLMGKTVRRAAEITADRSCIGCAKLVVFCNAPEDNPFMAGAFHGAGEPDCVINVGVSGPGATLRILRQDPAEAIIGFICSSSKRIIQIKRCVRALAGRFGEEICPGYRALPTFERLARADVSEILKCGLGFRAAYLSSTSKKITAEKFEAESLRQMPYLEAKKYLLGLSGVGDKVADCILLFGCARMEAFPVDTWVRKAMKELYGTPDNPQKIRDFAARKFPDYAGFAQQAIFAAKRNGLL